MFNVNLDGREETCESLRDRVLDTMYENEDLFGDMEFDLDSITGSYREVEDVCTECEDELDRPDVLEDFSYGCFDINIAKLKSGAFGHFNPKDMSVTIDPDHVDDEPVVLHQMIHMHEAVLNSLPTVYRDDCLIALYTDLVDEVEDLDDRLLVEGNLLTVICGNGDIHDLLFVLKSYDLDLKMGWELGTVLNGETECEDQ